MKLSKIFSSVFSVAVLCAFSSSAVLAKEVRELRVMTHGSFSIDKVLIANFEKKYHAKLSLLKAQDAGVMLNKLILTKASPIADVVYGIDNLNSAKAQSAGILDGELQPVDFGVVSINFDKAWVKKSKLPLPESLEDFSKAQYKNLLVVENPATSSTGLAFLVATIEHFGKEGAFAWWKKMKANGIKIVPDWSSAYQKEFSLNKGAYPFVISYNTSPAAEVFYSEGKYSAPPTANLFLAGSSFVQVEGIAILKGAKDKNLANQFIAFMLSDEVQSNLQTQMWMFPARRDVKLDPAFKFAEFPDQRTDSQSKIPVQMKTKFNDADLQSWLKEWLRVMR